MFSLVLEKAEKPEIKLPASVGSWKKQESSRKPSTCFIDYAKAFNYVDHNKLWNILKEMEYKTTLPVSQETCMQVKKQQLEPDMDNRLVQIWERSASRLYIVTLLI